MGPRHRSTLGALAILSALAIVTGEAGCAALLGIDDRTLIDASDEGVTSPGGDASSAPDSTGDAAAPPDVASLDAGSADAPDAPTGPDDGSLDTRAIEAAPADAIPAGDAGDAAAVPDVGAADAATMDAGAVPDASRVCTTDPCDMADGLNEPFVMTANAFNVYWVDYGDTAGAGNGQLMSCGVNGCNGTPAVWQSNLMDPRGIAVDSGNVYWSTTWGGIAGTQGAIWACSVALGPAGCVTPTKLASTLDPYGLAVDSQYVYWVDGNLHTVQRVNTTSAPIAQVLYSPPGGDGGLGVFLDGPIHCAVDSVNLYILDASANVYRMPKGGGTPVKIGSGNGIVADIAVDGTGAVYAGAQGEIQRVAAGASSATLLVLSPIPLTVKQPVGLAIDSLTGILYWADYGSGVANDGTIGQVGTTGVNPGLLLSGLETPSSVTVSGSYIYWIAAGQLLSSTSTSASYVANNTGVLWRIHK